MKKLICAVTVLAVSTAGAGVVTSMPAAAPPWESGGTVLLPKSIKSATLSCPTAKIVKVMAAAVLPGDCGIPSY